MIRRTSNPRQAAPLLAPAAPVAVPKPEMPWRDTAFLPLNRAAHVLGISPASLYRLENEGRLQFRRIAGRTLVATPTIAALADAAEDWSPSTKGAEARARRAELVRANWDTTLTDRLGGAP